MTLEAPTIDIRDRIPDEVIEELIARIAAEFRPQKIILFGSYANGTPRPESDIDLLVIMETSLREIQQALEIRQHINPLFGVDIIVYTPDRLKQRMKWGDSFLQDIVDNGRVMYESPDA